jgi:hypothetical protein
MLFNRSATCLFWSFTFGDDEMHNPTMTVIIIQCIVLGTAIVPHRQRIQLPAQTKADREKSIW